MFVIKIVAKNLRKCLSYSTVFNYFINKSMSVVPRIDTNLKKKI